MKTSKTYTLSYLFGQIKRSKYKTTLAVYFRVSLSKELVEMWRELGFELYSDIKGPISLKDHPRIVVQIDSLHRVSSHADLLILDEIESTVPHLLGSIYLNKQTEFNALKNYIKKTPNIVLADANLCDTTIELLLGKRTEECHKILNTYQSYTNLKARITHNKNALIHTILKHIEEGKRIVIPTNSKAFSKTINKLVRRRFPDKKVLLS